MTRKERVSQLLRLGSGANDNRSAEAPVYNFYGPVTIQMVGGEGEPSLSRQNLLSTGARRTALYAVPPLRKAE